MKMSPEHLALWKEIDRILWKEWDPIGVNDYEGPDDEYRGYIPQIFQMKIRGATIDEISKELYSYETINMGLSGNLDHCFEISTKISHLKT